MFSLISKNYNYKDVRYIMQRKTIAQAVVFNYSLDF